MTRLRALYDEQGQSPWLDNLTRPYLNDGTLAALVARGVRGVTANPTIVARAIEASDAYDGQFEALMSAGHTVQDAYWELAIDDVVHALEVLRPTFDASGGGDGLVSIEVSPACAFDTAASITAARALHERIGADNLLVKIPATTEGVAAIRAMIGEGRSINVTLIFSLARYGEVLEAYLSGLEALARDGGDLSSVRSVASFFVSRVDTEVDARLEAIGAEDGLALRGRAAVAQAKLAYRLFQERFSTERWGRLARRGAPPQRLLWSSEPGNRSRGQTRYVDELIGPDTVHALSWSTVAAFEDHGVVGRTLDAGLSDAAWALSSLGALGIDLDEVGEALETRRAEHAHDVADGVLDLLRATGEAR
jgi:transaldolase